MPHKVETAAKETQARALMTQDSSTADVAIRMIAKLLAATILAVALLAAPAQAAPTNYVTLTDGVQIAVNVKVPPQCTAATPCPAYFEMSGYESGSDDGKTPLGDRPQRGG
jgi:hypothetical protein